MTSNPEKRWRKRLVTEVDAVRRAASELDPQTITVLVVAAVLVIFQMKWGSRTFFRSVVAPEVGIVATGLKSWAWWFVSQGVWGFVIPILILRYGFRRSFSEMGLGAGDWKFASLVAVLYVPAALVGTWILSDSVSFQSNYPHLPGASTDWSIFVVYEALFLFYWVGWEYLWRGFILFGTARTFGIYAIFVQTLPFAILHYQKPLPEAMLSVVGGIALGALVWRARSFWIAVPIHAFQMLSLDFFSTLRLRTGVSGLGLDDFVELIRKVL
jgi:CAAX protease family protein